MKTIIALALVIFSTNCLANTTSYCTFNGTTQVCTNYVTNDNGDTRSDTSIRYNSIPANQAE